MVLPSNNPRLPGWEVLQSEIPETLWHYTSFSGFLGIHESKEILATNLHFLNDSEELQHARSLLEVLAREEQERRMSSSRFLKNAFLSQVKSLFEEGSFRKDLLQTYVACFSESKDQLSQWRGYAGQSTGISIGLDLRGLRKHVCRMMAVFAPCIYDDEKKRDILAGIMRDLFDSTEQVTKLAYDAAEEAIKRGSSATQEDFESWYKSNPECAELSKKLEEQRIETEYQLLHVAALMKNSAFREEREWRLVLPILKRFNDQGCRYAFAARADAIVPRLRQTLAEDGIPVTRIIIGPGSHPNTEEAVTSYFITRGIDVPIDCSEVPFRPSISM